MSSHSSASSYASAGMSIPEMLGFSPVPYDRERPYSALSYRALYCLTEDEAQAVRDENTSHSEIDNALSLRYIHDADYRTRIEKACEDITATPPDEEVRRIMRRLISQMTPPTEEARRKVEEIIGDLPEDKGGAA